MQTQATRPFYAGVEFDRGAWLLGGSAESNFRMTESKISIQSMHAHNKKALSLYAGDDILPVNHADDGISPIQII